jgi:nitrite reductase/ring-hydroxylating ferredoxin subunit
MHESTDRTEKGTGAEPPRRRFLQSAAGGAMVVGLGGGYGTLACYMGEFVYPARSQNRAWLFVCTVDRLEPGGAMDFTTPTGARIVIARPGTGTSAEDFLALSSICPHLGCQVHWEAQNDRFFCPCHNGAFDRSGSPIAGPPQAANQALVRFPLKVENGLLYLEASIESVACCTGEVLDVPPDPADSNSRNRRSEGVA